jgi:hypothetical protein
MTPRLSVPPGGILASPKTLHSGYPWTKEELRIIAGFARRLAEGKIPFLNDATDLAYPALKQWYSDLKKRRGQWDPEYPRTYDSVRSKIHQTARKLGRPMVCAFWNPPERQAARRWAKKTIGPFDVKRPRWFICDAARMLMLELMEKGYNRTFSSCENEVRKCRLDLLVRTTRRYGRRYKR